VFTEDAVQFNPGMPDVVGRDAIRRLYADALSQNDIKVQFHTREVVVAGDIAYEGGTYDIILKPRNDPKAASITVTNRHVHVLKRQADGAWKTWRMMTNSEAAVAAPQ
jgi:ketosteroid isomerase-like protein